MEFTRHSTGLSLGNLNDGLPGALHAEALWAGQGGVFGPAPIDDIDTKKIVSISDRKFKFPKVSFNFKNAYVVGLWLE